MLLLSLKTLLVFKIHSRFVFLFSFFFFPNIFNSAKKNFKELRQILISHCLMIVILPLVLYHLPTQSCDMIFFILSNIC